MDQPGSPIPPRASCTGDNAAGREVVAASSGPVIAEGGGLPPLPAPKHFSESGLPSGALAEAGGDSSVAALVACEDVEVAVCPRVVSGNALQDDVPGVGRGTG